MAKRTRKKLIREQREIFPDAVDFIITDKCDLHCPVCWGSEMPDYKIPILQKRLEIINLPRKYGATRFTITGGEPLLDPSLPRLLMHGKQKGMHQLLFTNCTSLEQKADEVLPYIDAISISLDGYDEGSNSKARKPRHFDDVMNALELFKTTHPVKSVQVLTVVTKLNKDYLEKIGELLRKKSKGLNFRWKLNYHQQIGRCSEKYHIPYQEFELIAKETQSRFSDMKVRHSLPEHDRGYLFVFPDGNMYTTEGREYTHLGNILDEKSWNKEIIMEVKGNMDSRDNKIEKPFAE